MDGPSYPSIPGRAAPDLRLAQYSVATPETALSINVDSAPARNTAPPPLDTSDPGESIQQMGIDPGADYFDLQLANQFNGATPEQLAAPRGPGEVNAPTFTGPEGPWPDLQTGDLTGPGITRGEPLAPDPSTGDLLQFARPGGLTIIAASSNPLASDPMAPDLLDYDRPAGLGMPGPLMVDPQLPDLQHPTWTPETRMTGRPGDLAPDALDVLHSDPSYRQLPDDRYNALWMQQQGDNQRRERHMGMLDLGLEREERAR